MIPVMSRVVSHKIVLPADASIEDAESVGRWLTLAGVHWMDVSWAGPVSSPVLSHPAGVFVEGVSEDELRAALAGCPVRVESIETVGG